MFSRRQAILAGGGGLAILAAPPASAGEFTYGQWRFNTDAVARPLSPELIASFQAQIDIVEGLRIKPEIKTFFRGVPCFVDETTPGGPGAYGAPRKRMILSTIPQPPANPVFLHELIHAYHHQMMPKGLQNPDVIAFLAAAKASKQFPPEAYMLSNPMEFFAMCASVTLWGKAARPPSTRETVRTKLPKIYDFILAEFGFQPEG